LQFTDTFERAVKADSAIRESPDPEHIKKFAYQESQPYIEFDHFLASGD
jgi:hypothetical protein